MKLLLENWRKYLNEEDENLQEYRGSKRQRKKNRKNAIKCLTTALQSEKNRWQSAWEQRDPKSPTRAGSYFNESSAGAEGLKAMIQSAEWVPAPPDIQARMNPPSARAYQAPIPGMLGIKPVYELGSTTEVKFAPGHRGEAKDDAGTVVYEALADVGGAVPVKHTTLIVAPDCSGFWTFFPGDPPDPNLGPKNAPRYIYEKDIQPLGLQGVETKIGNVYSGTVKDAEKLGFGMIKLSAL
jgi:hypothetical protein